MIPLLPMLRLKANGGVFAAKILLIVLAALIMFAGRSNQFDWNTASAAVPRRPNGHPQLISVEQLAAQNSSENGEMCQWATAETGAFLLATAQQERRAGESAVIVAPEMGKPVTMDRAPVRQIRDTFPTYSALAVDLQTEEVYLQDENLFGYKVFNRLDNTPPTAGFTEPKRVVQGMLTKMEFNCALYIDPSNGDVYSVNNDMVDTMVVFPRKAKGDIAPKKELHTPHRTYGIAADETRHELFLTVQHPAQVVVYDKDAIGEEKPKRILTGDRTQLADPHGIAIDLKKQWMFVANHGSHSTPGVAGSGEFLPPSIVVHSLQASGNAEPLRTIQGPDTRLNWPAALFLDAERGELYVANDADDSVLVYRESDSANAAPERIIKGLRTGLKNPTGIFVDATHNEVWVSNMGNHTASVFTRTANGDVGPLRTIRSAPLGKQALAIGNPGGVAYDSKRDQLLVPN